MGGHRTFRPSILAQKLRDYDVLNIGAAGTFIVRKPGSRAKFRAELMRLMPFETEVFICDGRDFVRLKEENPFGAATSSPEIVRFVTIVSRPGSIRTKLPVTFPNDGEWLVRVIDSQKQFVFGEYRRHMKTIGYLGQIDKLFSCPATTRNWNTVLTIVRLLGKKEDRSRGAASR